MQGGGGVQVSGSSSDGNQQSIIPSTNSTIQLQNHILQQQSSSSLPSFPIDQSLSQQQQSSDPIFYLPPDQQQQIPQQQPQQLQQQLQNQFIPNSTISTASSSSTILPPQVVDPYTGLGLANYLSSTPNFSPPESLSASPSTSYQGGERIASGSTLGGPLLSEFAVGSTSSWNSLGNSLSSLPNPEVAGTSAGIPRSLSMDVDLNFSASSLPSSTPSTTNGTRLTYPHYPLPTPLPHSNVQRHHPYAHPPRPPPLTHTTSAASLPIYFNATSLPGTPLIPGTAPASIITSEVSPVLSSTVSNGSTSSLQSPLVLSFPPIAPPISNPSSLPPNILPAPQPHRVHSAPVHSLLAASTNSGLTLSDPNASINSIVSNTANDMEGVLSNPVGPLRPGSSSGVMNDYAVNFLGGGGIESIATSNGGLATEWLNTNTISASLPIPNTVIDQSSIGNVGVQAGGAVWEGAVIGAGGTDISLKLDVPPPPSQIIKIKQETPLPSLLNNSTPSYFDAPSYAYSPQQPSSSTSTPSTLLPPVTQIDSAIPAIALVRNRLPILEAALSATASDPGNDEEEIWKGVEGAFEELKRVMMTRKETRRGVASMHSSKVCSHSILQLIL